MYTHKETAHLTYSCKQCYARGFPPQTPVLWEVLCTLVISTTNSLEEGLTCGSGSTSIHWHSMIVQSLLRKQRCQGKMLRHLETMLHHARNPWVRVSMITHTISQLGLIADAVLHCCLLTCCKGCVTNGASTHAIGSPTSQPEVLRGTKSHCVQHCLRLACRLFELQALWCDTQALHISS